jgi:SAM-dependent methyltransferase
VSGAERGHARARLSWPRLQLFEFNDQAWAPAAVRDTVVESLSRALEWGRVLEGLVAPFERFLDAAGAKEVLDLGAGGGGPARVLAREIARAGRRPPRFLLTDLHPRVAAWAALREESAGAIDFVPEPVDAARIPPALAAGRARTIINVLHQFPPALATAALADAVRRGAGIFVAEAFERSPLQFANFAPAGLPALLLNPLLSPRDRLAKAALTWLTPAALAISVWDGLVSTLRVYSEDELRQMVAPFGGAWRWEYGTWAYPPRGRGYYFRGVPG